MLFCIIMDLNTAHWPPPSEEPSPLDCLRLYISAVLNSSINNTVRVINSRRIVYDSSHHDDPGECIKEAHDRMRPEKRDMGVCAEDLGYALLMKPQRVFILSFSEGVSQDEYVAYTKCIFAAQRHGCRIDGYTGHDGSLVKMCCSGTGGIYLQSCTYEEFLRPLGTVQGDNHEWPIKCICCPDKRIDIGMICPICLSVYCKFIPICRKCKTKFAFKGV